jgi:hypothetical protein
MNRRSAKPGVALAANAGFPRTGGNKAAGRLAENGWSGYNNRVDVLRQMGVEACKL